MVSRSTEIITILIECSKLNRFLNGSGGYLPSLHSSVSQWKKTAGTILRRSATAEDELQSLNKFVTGNSRAVLKVVHRTSVLHAQLVSLQIGR